MDKVVEPRQADNRRPLFLVLALVLLSVVLASSWLGVSYYYAKQNSVRPSNPALPTTNNKNTTTFATANLLISYGNRLTWHNITNITPGTNSYDLTASVATVDSYNSSGLGSHYVRAIDQVYENSTNYWTLWIFCSDKNAWAASSWGADYLIIEKNGVEVKLVTGRIGLGTNTLAWSYQHLYSTDPSTWQPPMPGAAKTNRCW